MEVIKKTKSEIERIKAALKGNFLFAHLPAPQAKQIYDVMKKRMVTEGECVIKQVGARLVERRTAPNHRSLPVLLSGHTIRAMHHAPRSIRHAHRTTRRAPRAKCNAPLTTSTAGSLWWVRVIPESTFSSWMTASSASQS